MNIAIRPSEVNKKVITKVKSTYPNQKDIGGYRVDLFTNRKGGVEIPFSIYSMSSKDPDLEFFDAETGEPLGVYDPPEVDTGSDSMDELAKSIRLLIEHGFKIDGKVNSEVNPNKSVDITEDDIAKAEELLSTSWQSRMDAVKKIESDSIRQAMISILELKSNLGKTNKEILSYLSSDGKEEAVIIEVNDSIEEIDHKKIPKIQTRDINDQLVALSDI